MRRATSFRSVVFTSGLTVGLLWLAMFYGGGLWPLLAVACVPLLIYMHEADPTQALLCGLLTGLGHFLLQLYWIVFVLGQYGGLPLFLSVPALLLLALYMAGYLLFFVLIGRLFTRCFPRVSFCFCCRCFGWDLIISARFSFPVFPGWI